MNLNIFFYALCSVLAQQKITGAGQGTTITREQAYYRAIEKFQRRIHKEFGSGTVSALMLLAAKAAAPEIEKLDKQNIAWRKPGTIFASSDCILMLAVINPLPFETWWKQRCWLEKITLKSYSLTDNNADEQHTIERDWFRQVKSNLLM